MNTEDTIRSDALDKALVEIGARTQADIAAALKAVYGNAKWPPVQLTIKVIGDRVTLWRRVAGLFKRRR